MNAPTDAYHVVPSQLCGSIRAPASKSHSLRAILFASLAHGCSEITQPLASPDTQAMIAACRQIGAKITAHAHALVIHGVAGMPKTPDNIIDAGNSGQVLRFITAIAALTSGYVVMTGDHSIRHQRPMAPLITALLQLGAWCVSTQDNGYAPILVKGPLQPGAAVLTGNDSQFISALLIATAFVQGETVLTVTDPGEKPWIELTLHWFDRLGIHYYKKNYTHYRMPGNAKIYGFSYDVPGDFSSVAYPLVAALITGSAICIENVDMDDPQGDKALVTTLIQMGAPIDIDRSKNCLWVHKMIKPLKGCVIDVNDFIDAVTILAVVGCYAIGTTYLTNAAIARQKECNRLSCMVMELRKMGACIQETSDGLSIEGTRLQGALDLQSHGDHRMVLSLTVATLAAQGSSKIHNTACVVKSYPTFLNDMQQLGGGIVACNT